MSENWLDDDDDSFFGFYCLLLVNVCSFVGGCSINHLFVSWSMVFLVNFDC